MVRAKKVLLIDQNNQKVGEIATSKALIMAHEAGLDLVEIGAKNNPPVAKIVDYNKYVYKKKKNERKANQNKLETKTVRLKVGTADFHKEIQVKRAAKWLASGKKVRIEIRFYGREITYTELGVQIMQEVYSTLEELADVEQKPRMDGRKMIMILVPKD